MIKAVKRAGKKKNGILMLTFGISFVGFSVFYIFPFFFSFAYALIDNPIRREFVGMQNFIDIFHNPYFLKGLRNTAVFMMVSIPLNMLCSLGIAVFINRLGKLNSWFSLVFLVPLVIPSATTAFFWKNIFSQYGVLNKLLAVLGVQGIDWIQSKYGLVVMILIFLWKNIGYNMALFLSGLGNIPEEYYECASVEGAGRVWQFRKITLTYLTPTTFLVLIMSFVNSFKVFKEIYIMTGEYPPDSLYLLQHYMNNMFLSLNYSKLVSAVYILTIIIVFFVAGIFRMENQISKNLRF